MDCILFMLFRGSVFYRFNTLDLSFAVINDINSMASYSTSHGHNYT